jgi:hypothetical protein
MLNYLFLLRMRCMPLILFTVIFGHLLYRACLVINNISWWLMIPPVTLGIFRCVPSLRLPPPLHFFAWVSTEFSLNVKVVQCDNRREFDNNTSRSFLSRGVQLRMSCSYTSPPNGKAEQMIRTTNDIMRTLLLQASPPPHF